MPAALFRPTHVRRALGPGIVLAHRLARLATLWAALLPLGSRAVNLQGEVSASWAENINRASTPGDWRDAMRYDARGSLSVFREWRAGFLTTGALEAGAETVPKFSQLGTFHAGIAAQVRQKFGFGAFAPAVALDLGLRRREAKFAGDDGTIASAGLSIRKRVAEAWRVALIGDWQEHDARNRVFDTRHRRAFGVVTWDLTPGLQLSHANGRLWGDFVANASAAAWSRARSGELGPELAAYYRTVPWAATELYGAGWVSYRVAGRVSFWWLELAPALGRDTSLPFRYESRVSVNQAGVKYRQDVWTLQLLHRF